MPTLNLRNIERGVQKGDWLLTLSDDGGELVDAAGSPQAEFPYAQAERRFVFPSFWQSIKHLGVVTDNGSVAWFVPEGEHLETIKHYLGGALAAQGPAAIDALRWKAWAQVVGGTALLLFAVIGSAITILEAFGNPGGGRYIVAIGVLALGGTLLARGLAALGRARRATSELERFE
jgi:hypothetical protein